MKKLNILVAASLLTLTACNNAGKTEETPSHVKDSVTAPAQEAPVAEAPLDSATMQKNWQEYMTPGEMHKWMASTDGKWDAEMSFWSGPDQSAGPPSKASFENKMIMGGRYQESVYKGKMMGMDFEGHGTMAYDNAKKKFISTWIDNTGTGLMYMEGTYDEGTKTANLSGKMIDPSTGKDCEMREEIKSPDAKTEILTMYCTKDGKEFKSMEIKLTRK